MKRNELIKLRKLLEEELNKRNKINELSENELIKEYIAIKGLNNDKLDVDNIREILKQILEDFKVTETNGIYVCTNAYYIDCHIMYQDTEYYTVDVDIDSKYAERKTYCDIESGELLRSTIEKDGYYPLITDFERTHIVLNPYNSNNNRNGYEEVRLNFFEDSIKYGQEKSKRMVLSKYPRL